MFFVDSHSHLYADAFDNDRQESVQRALSAGVKHIVLPNIDRASIELMLSLSSSKKGICFPLIGLHPTSVEKNFEDELRIVEKYLSSEKFYGIGETGIDLYWDKTYIAQQKIAFRHQLKLAKQHSLPVVIHARNSFEEIFEIVDQENSSELTGVFHSFSGTFDQYKHIEAYGGFKVGIGGVVTYKNSNITNVVRQMSLDKIVLETDSPYLTPVPFRGKRNESAYIKLIAQKIAEIQDLPLKQVASITSNNAISLFSLQ